MSGELPSVTVGIPVLNEEDHIERVISGFQSTEYPNLIEILVADGGSSDRTQEIVNKMSEGDSRIKLMQNPEKYQSFALNRMIEEAKGDIFVRADGHCLYQEDYLEKNIKVFLTTKSKNVGGSQRYVASNRAQAGTTLAVKSFLGNGGAKYMNENYTGYADTVFLGCFWTKDLRQIGGFSTKNITNQDSELNLRFIEKYGEESIYISPEIKSWYYPRSTYLGLFKQYFRYGRGRLLTKLLHPKSSPIRGLIPFMFICGLMIYGLLDFFLEQDLYFFIFLLFLIVVLLGESMRVVTKHKDNFIKENWTGESPSPGLLSLWLHSMGSILVMQVGHFSGFLYQLIRKFLFRVKGW
ncbi:MULTISPECIES: glycosyltransferase family 2 protein [Gracilimonas]|uniref:glycosyltransferase family 2 protein n=1 Tax=Gracilimonas TaxID=649462 RepID=UPI0025C41008|nr:glycosyltransferase family 2 protein [Gracilimonas sp.]